MDEHADNSTSEAVPLEAQEGLIPPYNLSKSDQVVGAADNGGELLEALQHEVGGQQGRQMQPVAADLSRAAPQVLMQHSLVAAQPVCCCHSSGTSQSFHGSLHFLCITHLVIADEVRVARLVTAVMRCEVDLSSQQSACCAGTDD